MVYAEFHVNRSVTLWEEDFWRIWPFCEKTKWRQNHVTNQLVELKLKRAMDVDDVCRISCQSVCNLMRRRFFKVLASFTKKSKWRPNLVTNQLYELKLGRAMDVDDVCRISCQSVCNFMRRRFLKVLASFSKNQNGGQTTWPINFLSSNLEELWM